MNNWTYTYDEAQALSGEAILAWFGGEGWYEFTKLPEATTHVVHLSESGAIYVPESDVDREDLLFTASTSPGNIRKLVREDTILSPDQLYPAIDDLTEAIRFTAEYLGRDWLPAIEGWSWYDALKKYAPEKLEQLSDQSDSNLVKHAKKELALIDEEQSTVDGYIRIVKAFSDMNHSGGSASVAIPVINDLLQFKNLKPLTDDPDEWEKHSPDMWDGVNEIWQNRRNGKAFSKDGGKTFYLLDDGSTSKTEDPKMYISVPHEQ